MHAGFRQFAAFDQDAIENRAWLAAHGKLKMPVLAIAGAASFGPVMAVVAQAAAIDVQERIIPGSGHWLMEEQPAATVEAIDAFLNGRPSAAKEDRKSTRLNSSHRCISYAVFCLKKKNSIK